MGRKVKLSILQVGQEMKLSETRLHVLFRDYKKSTEEPLKSLLMDAIIEGIVATNIRSEFLEATLDKIGEMDRKMEGVHRIVDMAMFLKELSQHVILTSEAIEGDENVHNAIRRISDISSESAEAIVEMGRLEGKDMKNTLDTVEKSYGRLMRGDDLRHSLAAIDMLGKVAMPVYGMINSIVETCRKRVREIEGADRKMKEIREFRIAAEHWAIIATKIGCLLSESYPCNTAGLSVEEHVNRTRLGIVRMIQRGG